MNLNDLETSNKFFDEGNKKFDLDNFLGALNEYSKSIEFNPNNVDAYFNRGSVRFELNNFYEAIADFTKVINFSPKNEIAFLKRGETYFELKDYYSAVDDFTKVISLDHENEDAYFKRGLAKSKIGNFEGSSEDFSRAIIINPKFVEAIYSRGLVKMKFSDSTAEDDLKQALRIQPNYKDIYFDEVSNNIDKDEKINTIDINYNSTTNSYQDNQNDSFKYKKNYRNSGKQNQNKSSHRNTSKPIIFNNPQDSNFKDADEVYIKKENNKKNGQNIYNYNYVNTNKNDNSPISGWFILIFFIVSSLIVGVLIANGNYMEAVGVVFVSGILIDIFALFWRPSRKAIGLVNIILGVFMMLSIIGLPFGIILLLFGAILMFI